MWKEKAKQYRIVLASQSPRRRELLSRLGVEFEIIPAVGEECMEGKTPQEIVMHLAKQKAGEVYASLSGDGDQEDLLVIGADTVVAYDGRILGKPQGVAEAQEMLSMLSGKTHQVYTGVSILLTKTGEEQTHTFYEKTDVTFAELSKEELQAYIDSGDPFDKAGGYGIQGDFGVYVERINGDYNNVVGLPVARLYQELKKCM